MGKMRRSKEEIKELALMVQEKRKAGMSIHEIAEEMNVAKSYVHVLMVRNGKKNKVDRPAGYKKTRPYLETVVEIEKPQFDDKKVIVVITTLSGLKQTLESLL